MKDLISVITPTYNRENLISTAIESVLNQSYEHWELLIVDDASEDNTKNVIERFSDERIKYFKLKVNKGNAGARNVGLQNAKGRLITFLDSDDQLDTLYLEKFASLFRREPETNFAYGGYKVRDIDTGITKEILWEPNNNLNFLYELKIGTGCGIFFTNEVIERVGEFDENLRVAVDTDWLIRVNKIFKPKFLPEALITINFHSEKRVRDNKNELLKTYEIIVSKHYLEINNDIVLRQRYYHKLMWLYYHNGQKKGARKYFWEAFKAGNYNSVINACLFEIFPRDFALMIHQKASKLL